MCHYNNSSELKKIIDKGQNIFTVYKRLKIFENKFTDRLKHFRLYSPYKTTFQWQIGINLSDTNDTYQSMSTLSFSGEIDHGFHTYRSLKIAKHHIKVGEVIVKFKARKTDIIAANSVEIIFRNLFLEFEEYKRVIEEINAKKPKRKSR